MSEAGVRDGIAALLDGAWHALLPGFVPFTIGGAVVGALRATFAAHLREWPAVFAHDAATGGVAIRDELSNEPQRSAAVAPIVRTLAQRGIIGGWRDELYAVHVEGDTSTPLLLHVERAAARPFGITSHAVHVNGIVDAPARGEAPRFWIARRSPTKSIDPGMLDNLIGGGVPAGLVIGATLVKEAWEEAGLDAPQVAGVVPGRTLRIRREVPEGLQSELIYVHDLVLPEGLTPANQDGEVAGFALMSTPSVIAVLREGRRMTADASLVTLDCLARRGLVALPDSAQARAIFSSLATP
jgi:8-oxo-dGTP pyrophosphatase MutT (NUDIX family)